MLNERININLTEGALSIDEAFEWLQEDTSGGISLFIGTIRNLTENKEVKQIEFSSFKPMAIKEMEKIADEALRTWPVHKVLIHHRTGNLKINEVPVIIGVSSAHRKEAFAACQFAIDKLKETVPIWKKEFFSDGAIWVNAHP